MASRFSAAFKCILPFDLLHRWKLENKLEDHLIHKKRCTSDMECTEKNGRGKLTGIIDDKSEYMLKHADGAGDSGP